MRDETGRLLSTKYASAQPGTGRAEKKKSPDVLLGGKRFHRPTRGIDFSVSTKMSGRSRFSSEGVVLRKMISLYFYQIYSILYIFI